MVRHSRKRGAKRHKKRQARVPRNKLSLVKSMGNRGQLFTKEMVRTEYRLTADADGIAVVNGFSTALLNQFPDTIAWQDLQQADQYGSLWKMYRIRGIRYQFYNFHNMAKTNDSSAVTQNELKWFWYKYPNNAEPNPTSGDPGVYNEVPRIRQFKNVIDLYFKNPKAVSTLWADNTATAGQSGAIKTGRNYWLPTDGSEDVKHYGLRFGLMNCEPTATYTLKCTRTIYFQLKNPR